MPLKSSSLKQQSFAVCLISLCLICFICFTSAYFTTFDMAETDAGENCPGVAAGGEEKHCPKTSGSVGQERTQSISTLDNRHIEASDSPSRDQSHKQSDGAAAASENKNFKPRSPNSSEVKHPSKVKEKTDEMWSRVKNLNDRYVASMVLSGVGDALGYYGGRWEFNYNGTAIHEELKELGGLEELHLRGGKWVVSDDTVMHLATAEALVKFGDKTNKKELYKILAKEYIECMNDMVGRAAGPTCIQGTDRMKRTGLFTVPFNRRGGGCGAAMRAMCIGLRYPLHTEIDDLTAVSIESGRMTHHHPTGYLGAFAAALFTSYAIQNKPTIEWGHGLMNELKRARKYVKDQKVYAEENLEAWSYFEEHWKKYLDDRGISDGKSPPKFPDEFGVETRDDFYKALSFGGWGGSSGHDAPMIAYDALLGSNDSWIELCKRGMLHGGDNDSTGTMAGAWFGALYGIEGVPKKHYEDLEYHDRLEKLGKDLYALASA